VRKGVLQVKGDVPPNFGKEGGFQIEGDQSSKSFIFTTGEKSLLFKEEKKGNLKATRREDSEKKKRLGERVYGYKGKAVVS